MRMPTTSQDANDGVEFGALLADKAFDINDIVPELNERGAKIVTSQHPRRAMLIPLDAEMQMASPYRKLVLQIQMVQTHRHVRLQNRPQLRGHELPRRSHHQLTMNPHKP